MTRRTAGLTVLAVLVLGLWWWSQAGSPAPTGEAERRTTDPVSGLAWVAEADLPGLTGLD